MEKSHHHHYVHIMSSHFSCGEFFTHDNLSCREFVHLTICYVENLSTWKSVIWTNFSTWQIFFHGYHPRYPWQIWGMLLPFHRTKFRTKVILWRSIVRRESFIQFWWRIKLSEHSRGIRKLQKIHSQIIFLMFSLANLFSPNIPFFIMVQQMIGWSWSLFPQSSSPTNQPTLH